MSHLAIVVMGLDKHIKPGREWEMDGEECGAQKRAVQSIRDHGGCQWLPDAMRRQRSCFAQISKDEKRGPVIACAIQIKLRFPLCN